ncbi:glycosyltransferase family 32 protein [Zopfia rhizophila CBS 207.26]|uniref:Glycosyltransferase family 32 protein n=1 Tax=Zopfia rhizophila CBS 207.26 TaxID=1314779 RepID=A0A6A6DNB5_9PEZI|nr:glycosyltransferase family 32 protein [Zopfia rhizophila CBS 207.26]
MAEYDKVLFFDSDTLITRPMKIRIVHYVFLKKDENSTLHFEFQDFLSIYASLIYFKPAAILIHTDHNSSTIKYAASYGNKWTRKILNDFPKVVRMNQVQSPTQANGTVISKIEHKSDFVRIDEIYRTGGIYLDLDVLPLRDVRLLRESGYQSIVGRQFHGRINNGAFMAQKGSALVYLMKRDGPVVFNGGWETHSTKLITSISERLVSCPGEVLIMDEIAFSPTSWTSDSVDRLFAPHNETAVPFSPQVNDPEKDPVLRWDNTTRAKDWEIDFSGTYLLHAYKARGHQVPGFNGVTVPYVLARDSNYALAAWPVVRHALDYGVIDESDDEP